MQTNETPIDNAFIAQELTKLKPYALVILKKGPNYERPDTPERIRTQHLPYVFKLKAQGIVAITMPVRDTTDVTAIGIFTVTDKGQVKQYMEADPAVIEGIFLYEIVNAIGLQGDTLL